LLVFGGGRCAFQDGRFLCQYHLNYPGAAHCRRSAASRATSLASDGIVSAPDRRSCI
jgi:hypothetical protein